MRSEWRYYCIGLRRSLLLVISSVKVAVVLVVRYALSVHSEVTIDDSSVRTALGGWKGRDHFGICSSGFVRSWTV